MSHNYNKNGSVVRSARQMQHGHTRFVRANSLIGSVRVTRVSQMALADCDTHFNVCTPALLRYTLQCVYPRTIVLHTDIVHATHRSHARRAVKKVCCCNTSTMVKRTTARNTNTTQHNVFFNYVLCGEG